MKRGNLLYKNITGDVVRLNDSSLSWITAGATREYFGHGEKKNLSPSTLDRWLPSKRYFQEV